MLELRTARASNAGLPSASVGVSWGHVRECGVERQRCEVAGGPDPRRCATTKTHPSDPCSDQQIPAEVHAAQPDGSLRREGRFLKPGSRLRLAGLVAEIEQRSGCHENPDHLDKARDLLRD